MPDVLTIGGALASLKTANEIARSFIGLRDQATIQTKVIELQSVILSAQSSALAAQGEQFALLENKRELETSIADLEAWNREKQRYALNELATGRFAYTLKENEQAGEPIHHICANCYQERRKPILIQFEIPQGRASAMKCHHCGSEIVVRGVDMRTSQTSDRR